MSRETMFLKSYWKRSGALRHRYDLIPVECLATEVREVEKVREVHRDHEHFYERVIVDETWHKVQVKGKGPTWVTSRDVVLQTNHAVR